MARKGSQKVRTGCLTCKARKVKCDEAKPKCNRCVTTGRKCDGYLPQKQEEQRPWHNNQHQLLANPSRTFPGVETRDEGRALQYFREIAGPYLSGPTDRYFWTHLVMQFANFEPAVRHSVVAISSLYEQLPGLRQRAGGQDQRLVLTHYNAAIRELKTMTALDKQPLVLLVCILFICIEFLQSNDEAAIKHCKHGITMLAHCGAEYQWTRQFLEPIFRRLSLFPFFFGRENSDYPSVYALSSPVPERFHSFVDARSVMDEIFTRSVRIMRLGDDYRVGQLRHQPFPDSLHDEKVSLSRLLDTWDTLFTAFLATDEQSDTGVTERPSLIAQQSLLVRFDICRIMSDMAVERSEIGYDIHIERFKRIAGRLESLASSIPAVAKEKDPRSPKFTFDMGFMPVMNFCMIKCRDFETRLRIWRLMPILSSARESLWNLSLMIALTRRVIEIEHRAHIDEDGQHTSPASSEPLPDRMRIRHMWADSMPTCRVIHGQTIVGRVAGFFMLDNDDNIYSRTEFINDPDYRTSINKLPVETRRERLCGHMMDLRHSPPQTRAPLTVTHINGTMASQSLEDISSVISSSIHSHYEAIKSLNYKVNPFPSYPTDISSRVQIHSNPELAYKEFDAHSTFTSLLASPPFSDLGITVTPHAHGVETAFSADFGFGGRLIVFNAEYDALPGIGHACGHNLIASSALAAFIGVIHALKASGQPGRVRLLGTPAEEGGGGKLHLIKAGAYADAAACLMTHPGPQYLLSDNVTGVAAAKMLANVKWRVGFQGKTAHASMEPWNGVNALDAVCLSYNAVSMLRQQIRPHERIHGIFDEAGDRPSVIPNKTSVTYYIRSDTLAAAERLWARVKACFDGAALATGCTVSYDPINTYADLRSSLPLCRAFIKAMASLQPTTSPTSTTAGTKSSERKDETVSLFEPSDFIGGSTDMGNVTYVCPGIHVAFGIDTAPGQGNHTTGFADASALEKSLTRAVEWGQGMAIVGWRVLNEDAFAEEVKTEWEEDMKRASQ
ncbi:hypothetical protein FDECE_5449 [Fusarium decemcellulare]|nr:hypothetical protein FDECE_5449 [Fusarium decemcellulare]